MDVTNQTTTPVLDSMLPPDCTEAQMNDYYDLWIDAFNVQVWDTNGKLQAYTSANQTAHLRYLIKQTDQLITLQKVSILTTSGILVTLLFLLIVKAIHLKHPL